MSVNQINATNAPSELKLLAHATTRENNENKFSTRALPPAPDKNGPETPPYRVDEETLIQIVDQLNSLSEIFSQQYQFSIDKETKQLVMKVTDITSGKVIRQIPSDEILSLAAQMNLMVGIFMDQLA